MNTKLIWITPNAEAVMAYCARVSNPSNQDNPDYAKLLSYCYRNKHFSVFEMASACFEIKCSRAIARQILRHRSFNFQEFCISGDSLITCTTNKGKSCKRSIKDLYWMQFDPRMQAIWDRKIRVYDLESKSFSTSVIKEIFKTGVKKTYTLTLEDGKTINSTLEHKFFDINGEFRPLGSFTVGEYVAVNGQFVYRKKSNEETSERVQTVRYKKILSIEYNKEEETYDLEVDHISHNYIANGIVVHNSGRYSVLPETPIISDARSQDLKNRQNSIDDMSDEAKAKWIAAQQKVWDLTQEVYKEALADGVAREVARNVLPEGMVESTMYMSGTIRSWIHYIEVRTGNGTQKEHMDVANSIKAQLCEVLPTVFKGAA